MTNKEMEKMLRDNERNLQMLVDYFEEYSRMCSNISDDLSDLAEIITQEDNISEDMKELIRCYNTIGDALEDCDYTISELFKDFS